MHVAMDWRNLWNTYVYWIELYCCYEVSIRCIAICPSACSTNQYCSSPGTCSCTSGWTGVGCLTGKNYNKVHLKYFFRIQLSVHLFVQMLVFAQVLVRVPVLQLGLIHDVQLVCFLLLIGFLKFRVLYLFFCSAVCTSPCQNGGTCSSPNTCTCTSQWTGFTCTIREFYFKL